VDVIKLIESQQMKAQVPEFRTGDTVRVAFKVVEGGRERIQPFEGTVMKRKGSGVAATFTVRRVTYGVGVERTFPLHSPRLEGVTVLRHGAVRRARLNFLRERTGKAARVKEAKR
jgi:large subunit ribosomal protein L19